MQRECKLVTGEIYHVFTKSIAGYTVFNRKEDFDRVLQVFRYYQIDSPPRKFSDTFRMVKTQNLGLEEHILEITEKKLRMVQMIAYCVMPTHLHFILKQLRDDGVETFMRKILNSYTKYFNALHGRKGPLWERRFQNVRVETNEQLFHLSRYVHLNPVTAYLTEKAENWEASSYLEYLDGVVLEKCLCDFRGLIDMDSGAYRQFVEDGMSYQRELANIKNLLLD